MKKFEELKNIIEANPNHYWAVYGDKKPCAIIESNTIKVLLADREQLRECLRVIAVAHEFERGSCMKANVAHKAREALKKSDEVEKIKEIVEV